MTERHFRCIPTLPDRAATSAFDAQKSYLLDDVHPRAEEILAEFVAGTGLPPSVVSAIHLLPGDTPLTSYPPAIDARARREVEPGRSDAPVRVWSIHQKLTFTTDEPTSLLFERAPAFDVGYPEHYPLLRSAEVRPAFIDDVVRFVTELAFIHTAGALEVERDRRAPHAEILTVAATAIFAGLGLKSLTLKPL